MYKREMVDALITSEKGFYIGDICYALDDKLYHGEWGERHGYEDGIFAAPGTDLIFAVASTAYGDGEYYGNDGSVFPVDAGNIGAVPLELVKEGVVENCDFGCIVNVPGTLHFTAKEGIFLIGKSDGQGLIIDTTDEYTDEDEDCLDEEDTNSDYYG